MVNKDEYIKVVICNTTKCHFMTDLSAFKGQFFNPKIPGLDAANPGIMGFGLQSLVTVLKDVDRY